MHHNGGDPFYSRHLRSLLLEAGFSKTEGHAVAADHYGRLEETRRLATVLEDIFRSLTQSLSSLGRMGQPSRTKRDDRRD